MTSEDHTAQVTHERPVETLTELAKLYEKTRRKRLDETEPDTREEASISGYERGLDKALRMFEDLDDFSKSEHLPEWQIGLENRDGEWEWYYPRALRRGSAIQKAKERAVEDLGDGPLNAYEVGGPIAE